MGPIHNQKKEIKRGFQDHRHGIAKARKMTAALLNQLEKAQNRLEKTETEVNALPGEAVDTMLKLLERGKNRQNVAAQLQELMHNLNKQFAPQGSRGILKTTRRMGRRSAPPHMTSSAWRRRSPSLQRSSFMSDIRDSTSQRPTQQASYSSAKRPSTPSGPPPPPPNSRESDTKTESSGLES